MHVLTSSRWQYRAIGLVMAFTISGCMPSANSTGAQPVTLKIGVPGAGTNPYGLAFVARDQGILAKYNIQAEITEYQGAGPQQEALASGDADIINFIPSSVALAVSKGVKEKIVATWQYSPNGWHMLTAANSSIRSPRDLQGKKVGISGKGTATDMFALWYAQQHGVQVETIPIGGAQAVYAAMLSGQVDASINSTPLSLRGLAAGEVRSLFDYGKEMPPNSFDVVVASDAIIDRQPQAVSNYLKALFEAVHYMKQNRDASIEFLVNYNKTDRASAERDFDAIIMTMPNSVEIKKEWLENALGLAALAGLKDLAPVEQIYTTKFVEQQ
jgi:NitT/TauT family transport system substrate-binding protein